MKFSTQEEYGLRCLIQLAQSKSGSLTIPEIGQLEGLSPTHVAKLLAILKRDGFISSTRGQSGGYSLAFPASQIRLDRVLDSLGGRLLDSGFCERHSGTLATCTHEVNCSLKSLWTNIQIAVDQVTSQVTLQDLVDAGKTASGTVNVSFKGRESQVV